LKDAVFEDIGSTGRGTNVAGDADFDYTLTLNQALVGKYGQQ